MKLFLKNYFFFAAILIWPFLLKAEGSNSSKPKSCSVSLDQTQFDEKKLTKKNEYSSYVDTEGFIGAGGSPDSATCRVNFNGNFKNSYLDKNWIFTNEVSANAQSSTYKFKIPQSGHALMIVCQGGSVKYPVSYKRIQPALAKIGINLNCEPKEIRKPVTPPAAGK